MSKVQSAERAHRPTRADVDLSAIIHNLGVLRGLTAARIYAVIKADAYGHGAIPVARALAEAGADGFCVALAEEGLELRDAGIKAPVLVMNGVYGNAHREVLARRLTPVVYERGDLEAFRRTGLPISMHLKVDTGMARLGVDPSHVSDFVREIPPGDLEGLMTHFASADTDDEFTDAQLATFARVRAAVQAGGHQPTILHAANTAATLRRPDAHFDAVRVGLALYGYTGGLGLEDQLRPAMRLRSEIIAIRDVPRDGKVGYGGTFRAARPSRIATVPLGYADGLLWALSNRGSALVRGRRCPIVGRVSMDLTGIDVTDVPDVMSHDSVVFLGDGNGDGGFISAEEVAAAASTIPYEVLTNVSRRVPRVYV